MAQSGFTPISLYLSTTAAAVPTSGNLVAGELAINTVDEKLYFKNSSGTVKLLASSAGSAATVSNVSVVSANGFTGIVATPTSTPAITLTTSITGVLKGNATAISAAVAGTDYVTPTGTETLTNKTLTAPTIASISNTGTLTLPTSTDTLVGRATTDTLTNKTLTAPTIASANLTTGLTLAGAAGSAGQVLTSAGTGLPTWSVSPAISVPVSARTSNTILGTADSSTLIDVTSGTFTQTYTAAATLASGWFCYYRNTGTGVVTHDPNGGELIGGTTTATMNPGDVWLIQCTGTAFVLTRLVGNNSVVYTSGSNTFTVPSGVTRIYVECWGGGGGVGAIANGAGGGGYAAGWINTTPGATITGSVGAGGAGANAGSNSSFSTFSANGGSAGASGAAPSLGGTASGGTINISGGTGGSPLTGVSQAIASGGAAPRGGLGFIGVAGGDGGTPGGGAAAGSGSAGPHTGGSGQINISWV